MDEETANAISNALVQDDLMKQTADYLGRGRQLKDHPLDQLNEKWILAARKWTVGGYEPLRELNDLSAEFRLRQEKEPWDRVPEVQAQMVEEIARSGPHNPGIREKIQEFLEAMDQPKN